MDFEALICKKTLNCFDIGDALGHYIQDAELKR
jgi:hypothetical protein